MPPTDKQARDVKQRLSAQYLGQPGVSGVGVEADAQGQPVVVIHLNGADPHLERQIPTELDGVPITVSYSGPFEAFPRGDE